MEYSLNLLRAILECPYKAWQLNKVETTEPLLLFRENGVNLSSNKVSQSDKVILSALYLSQHPDSAEKISIRYCPETVKDNGIYTKKAIITPSKYAIEATNLLDKARQLFEQQEQPSFYRIKHCSECQFKGNCDNQLKERDCISLLPSMTPTTVEKNHQKGITTISQLASNFRPKKRMNTPNPSSPYFWELRALAIKERKTYVIKPPDLKDKETNIYIDIEGLPDVNMYYLIGVLIIRKDMPLNAYSFWARSEQEESTIFQKLLSLLADYPESDIYHFGSYEANVLKQIKTRYQLLSNGIELIEKRLVNLLTFFRTHVFPPTYSNGLKDLANFAGFSWTDPSATGTLSIQWRKSWEANNEDHLKEMLCQYNMDDCKGLSVVHNWLLNIVSGSKAEDTLYIQQMKRHSPYKLQSNKEYGEDFQTISKAAYFDYQRTRIYWRDSKKSPVSTKKGKDQSKQGQLIWQPKTVNEVYIYPVSKQCKYCGHHKLYHSKARVSTKVTDLKFTSSGVKSHVIEYQSGRYRCAKCGMKANNKNLRMMHYVDNLFSVIVDYYVNYHISHELISKLIKEYYGIKIGAVYIINYKRKWWAKWQSEVEYVKSIVLNSPVLHIDETTIQLENCKGYVWAFATIHSVFYVYTPTREIEFVIKLLQDYSGIIVTDFYPGYDSVPVKHQKCLVHFLRDMNDDLFKNQFDAEFKGVVMAFKRLMIAIIKTIDEYGLKRIHLAKHLTEVEVFRKEYIDVDYKSKLALKYLKRFNRHWEELWIFLKYDGVPWNNNNAEAAIKAFAIHRRGVKGQMSERGIAEYLQMLTIAQTCRYRDFSFLDILRQKKGIWENIKEKDLPGFLPFRQARLYCQKLKLNGKDEWIEKSKLSSLPTFIPVNPDEFYKDSGWESWEDWLGISFLQFHKARTYIHRLGLKTKTAYRLWLRSGKRLGFIPKHPEIEYKHTGWISLEDWIGKKPKL